jgi:hypothetical protein
MRELTPSVSYDGALRDRLQDGDLILCTGNGPMSRLIRWFTKSRFSHAAVVLHWHGRVLVAEASGAHGVRVWLLSACVKKYSGRVSLFQPTPEARARLDLERLRKATMNYLGTGYRTMGLFQLGWHLLWARKRALEDPHRRPPKREFICSELVSACYRSAGVDLVPGVPDGYTTPADIEHSSFLVRVGRLTPAHVR